MNKGGASASGPLARLQRSRPLNPQLQQKSRQRICPWSRGGRVRTPAWAPPPHCRLNETDAETAGLWVRDLQEEQLYAGAFSSCRTTDVDPCPASGIAGPGPLNDFPGKTLGLGSPGPGNVAGGALTRCFPQLAHAIRLLLEFTDTSYEEKRYTCGEGNAVLRAGAAKLALHLPRPGGTSAPI
ncbi:hypothetical protein P7K49_016371 [Saguinus oedipus]|uniref:Uncharacterized protein n=1 Tax=Saguinus oedipus TaxID=9490 RepID=A0ABQ9VCC3_SAGOE|nr:hypothetical protein P7K49_016371 [Saguinus oedipus]